MINALKAKGVPILWVGLPAIRGTKSTSDMAYMDEIYRERAEKAGIAYVDIWDGFVDDQGRYTLQGPDFEGQTRKLRTADGVHFTKAGAVKLASYVDQELRRIISNRATPVALPGPDATAPKPAVAVGTHPDVGPVVPLVGGRRRRRRSARRRPSGADHVDRSGRGQGAHARRRDRGASGRADDFAWPRRGTANPATADTGPLPGPEQAAPAPGPKKGADTKKQPDAKAADAKNKPAPDQGAAKPHRAPSASLDGAPRPPRDVGGGF